MELFEQERNKEDLLADAPLADRMRPGDFEKFIGQAHLLADGLPFRKLIEQDSIGSIILWGAPGNGKSTLARLIAGTTKKYFEEISAVTSGIPDLRRIIGGAERRVKLNNCKTILFIDEVHRFNKVQQDAILPFVEKGIIYLIGATTENPALEVIPALRSRCRIYRLDPLSPHELCQIIKNAISDPAKGFKNGCLSLDQKGIDRIVALANGDARFALNTLEAAYYASEKDKNGTRKLDCDIINKVSGDASVLYDKMGSEHFDHASAFQKSLRGSDPDAAIYWLAKMIAGGEAIKFISRRLIVTAAEDVGNADPMALTVAVAAAEASEKIGLPEARIPLAQATIYVACAPKSNSSIRAIDKALSFIKKEGRSYPVPDRLKDSHYKDAAKYGFGVDYKFPHDYPGHYVPQNYLPENIKNTTFYLPGDYGKEREMKEYLKSLKSMKGEKNEQSERK